jgi:NYN domain
MDHPLTPTKRPRVALLIDGENVAPSAAVQIILKASQHGDLVIRRVYGNAATLGSWNSAPGIRPIHSGIGKNATDLLIAVEAMGFVLGGQADVLVLASSDRDFVHLVTHLRERSIKVVGIGESKAPEGFRKSCSAFLELKTAQPAIATQRPTQPPSNDLDEKIAQLIKAEGEAGAIRITTLSGRMHAIHKAKISEQAQKTWRSYLEARPHLYSCDPKGQEALVRLKA